MASTSPRQRRITGRVMHEFKHGELKRGRSGKAGKVKSRRQAIAIALEEAGKSKYESSRRNRRNLRRTENKRRAGPHNRNAKASRTSALGASARAHGLWVGEMLAKRPQEAAKPRGRAPEKAMVTPDKHFMPKPGGNTSRGAQR
jgi:hypothetical protein